MHALDKSFYQSLYHFLSLKFPPEIGQTVKPTRGLHEYAEMSSIRRFIDIGANLTDGMYNGIYHGSKKHDADLNNVLERSWSSGLDKIIVTGGSLDESKTALDLSQTDARLYCTVGCHPTRCVEMEDESGDSSAYIDSLVALVREGKDKVVAIGECGLDYDRLEFCPKEIQKKCFEAQLTALGPLRLPLFLHCRNAASDLVEILTRHESELSAGGVVHSFDGSQDDAAAILDLGYYIGINGCSLKTELNLNVLASIPSDRLLLETDSPWCEVRPTHAGSKYVKTTFPSVKKEKWQPDLGVKGRNEPANIRQVLEIVAAVRGEDADELCEKIYLNSKRLFFPNEK